MQTIQTRRSNSVSCCRSCCWSCSLLFCRCASLPTAFCGKWSLHRRWSTSSCLETCEGRRFDEHMETKRNKGTRDLCTLDATLDATLIDLLWAANGRNQQFNFHYIFVNSVPAPNKPFFQAHFPAKYFTSCYFLTVWSLPGDTVSSSLLGNPTFSSCFCSCLCCICQANSLIHHAHHRLIWLPT